MANLKEKLISIFYPNRCFICDKVIPAGDETCRKCAPLILHYPLSKKAACEICGFPLDECSCGKWRYYKKAVFPLLYDGDVRISLHTFKFRGRLDKVKPFAECIYNALSERGALDDIDVLTYVPMEKKQQYKRGYNQAEELCKELSKLSGVEMLPLLYKFMNTAAQHDTNGLKRQGNVLGIYEPYQERLGDIEGKNILIVDDILTSGATLNEAAKTLLIFGAEKVYAATAAGRKREPKKNEKK